MASKKQQDPSKRIADNKKAAYNYFFEERFEAGMVLEGWEVKALREGKVQLTDGYVVIRNGEMYLIDERGIAIDAYGPQYSDFDLPIVDGLVLHNENERGGADQARSELAARVITALSAKPAVAKRLSQVDVSDAHNATVILNGDTAVIQLGDDQFLQRLESYLDLASALRERVADIDYVDLRFEDRIYVRPARNKDVKRKVR